ncbi:MAG: hypothetical protein F6K47_38745 [Symploca sp. SIO2E6]|nr:hypothetical protein [Symploca sp. SIO2E6]
MSELSNQGTVMKLESIREEVFSQAAKDANFKAKLLSNPEQVLKDIYNISSAEEAKTVLGESIFYSSLEDDLGNFTDELRNISDSADTKKTKRIFCCS